MGKEFLLIDRVTPDIGARSGSRPVDKTQLPISSLLFRAIRKMVEPSILDRSSDVHSCALFSYPFVDFQNRWDGLFSWTRNTATLHSRARIQEA